MCGVKKHKWEEGGTEITQCIQWGLFQLSHSVIYFAEASGEINLLFPFLFIKPSVFHEGYKGLLFERHKELFVGDVRDYLRVNVTIHNLCHIS
jgi:hypothetical protein